MSFSSSLYHVVAHNPLREDLRARDTIEELFCQLIAHVVGFACSFHPPPSDPSHRETVSLQTLPSGKHGGTLSKVGKKESAPPGMFLSVSAHQKSFYL